MSISSIRAILSGKNAFYKNNYPKKTIEEFTSAFPPPALYQWNSSRHPQSFFHSFHLKTHEWAAYAGILPASSRNKERVTDRRIKMAHAVTTSEKQWKYKRIGIEVDGYHVDVVLMGKTSTLANGKWVLQSNGNGELYEYGRFASRSFKQILTDTNSNALVFNYPGVGASSGTPNQEILVKVYKALLTFLEDAEKGVGAKKIIGMGFSIGGGVQGEALKTHTLSSRVKYLFIKDRSFSEIARVPETLPSRVMQFLGKLIRLLGWNLDSATSSKALKAPEIILQTAQVKRYTELQNSKCIIGDAVISAEASLAKTLLDDPQCDKKNKVFIGVPEMHNEHLSDPKYLARVMNKKI